MRSDSSVFTPSGVTELGQKGENLGKHKQQGDHGGQYGTHSQAAMEIQSAARTAFRDMTDRSYVTLRFTSDGFVADNRMTFK